jgi:ubiquinone/menaquinone biosynthesis C-methylase UbiE
MVADLTCAYHIPSDTFDCILLTQTLQFIYDVRATLKTLYRILKPAGILLATCPGISQISRYDMERWGDHWRFTSRSSRRLFAEVFPSAQVTVEAHGNVLTALAFLHGLAAEELRQEELDSHDPDYEVVITVRAVKPTRAL